MDRKHIKCKVCNEFHWSDQKCDPIFTIEYEYGNHNVYAWDSEDAAEKFAELYNESHEYWLMDNEMKIKVIDSNGVEKKFIIGAEQSVEYWCKEV